MLNIIERKDGLVAHADVSIEGARFMLREEYPEYNFKSPESIAGTPINLFVYVKDVEAFFKRARASGVKVMTSDELKAQARQVGL